MLRAFPLILVAVVLYNVLVFGGAAAHHDSTALLAQSFAVKLFSGDDWKISLGDLFLGLCLVLLFIETVNATRTNRRELLNHALSILTFTAALVEFITLKGFGSSSFFLVTAMCLFDVVAGYTISLAARRDLNIAPPPD